MFVHKQAFILIQTIVDFAFGVDPVGGDGEIVSGEGGAEEVGDEGEGEKCRETEED